MSRCETSYDVIVVGTGAVGAAALYQLGRRGVRVLGLDRFHPPHDRGSSHGDTRITRLALGEGPQYVQFARRSHEIWRELETVTGRQLLRQVGGLIFGSSAGRTVAHGATDFLRTTIAVAQDQGILHEVLEAGVLPARFPQFRWRGDELGYFEPEAGFVHPEACIAAQLEAAQQHGAQFHPEESLLEWRVTEDSIQVTTHRGCYEAERLVLCAGAWLPEIVVSLAAHARVFRQVLFWFEPDGPHDLFVPERMPVFIRVPDARAPMMYGFPAIDGPGGGLKIAGEQFDESRAADDIAVHVRAEEMQAMHAMVSPHVRLSARCVRAVVCKYTVTPDFQFVIDQHPKSDRVWFASACSGHGFKHSAAVGEALAEVVSTGRTCFDLSPFRLSRFNQAKV